MCGDCQRNFCNCPKLSRYLGEEVERYVLKVSAVLVYYPEPLLIWFSLEVHLYLHF